MRTTLQTVPESLPADHITNSSGTTTTTTTTTVPAETATTKSSHSHTNASLKGRQSSTKVCTNFLIFLFISGRFSSLKKKKDEETASEYLGIVVMHVEVMETHMMDRCIRFDIDGVPVFCLLVSIWALSSKL